jgi:hypothetical protein
MLMGSRFHERGFRMPRAPLFYNRSQQDRQQEKRHNQLLLFRQLEHSDRSTPAILTIFTASTTNFFQGLS